MKTNRTDSNRSRLTCRLVQGWISIAGNGNPTKIGAFGRQHVQTCECCRQFFEGEADLEASLRREAARERRDVPAGLDEEIIAAVHRSRFERRPRSQRRFFVAAVFGASAAAASVFAFLMFGNAPVHESDPIAATFSEPAGEVMEETVPEGVWSWWQPSPAALLGGEPLRREVDAVYSDVRSAVSFLALNFLPSRDSDSEGSVEGVFAPNRPADG